MRDLGQLYFATNKEIHDTLFSAKQKVTEAVVVHDLLRDRGIICSPHDTREALIRYLSVLPHDYADICGLLEKREATKRGEKAATVAINIPLTSDELKEIVADYQSAEVDEVVNSHKKSETEFVVNVTYSEFDYSKTRLLQRQERDAAIEFVQVDGGTEIRIPATDRARAIVSKLKDRIAEKKKANVILQEIELSDLSTEQRTTFFTKLMSTLPNFAFVTATRLRVAHGVSEADSNPLDIEDGEISDAEEQLLGVVKSVALSGENLVASKMYQDLKEKGFFVTSLTWEVRQRADPFLSAELYAGFEEGQAGKKFRYWVQGVRRFKDGQYPKNARPASDGEKAELLSMIERTARSVLAELFSGGIPSEGGVE